MHNGIVSRGDSNKHQNTYEPVHVISNNVVFWQVQIQTSLCSLLLILETQNAVQSVGLQSYNIQATSKGSDQSVLMRRLVWAFACRTNRMVGDLMVQLICHG